MQHSTVKSRSSWLVALAMAVSGSSVGCLGDSAIGEEPATDDRELTPDADDSPGSQTSQDDTNDANTNEGDPNPSGLDDPAPPATSEDNGNAANEPLAPPRLDVADTAYCEDVADWDPEWVEFEEEVLRLVNEARAGNADCGVEGQKPPVPRVTTDPILRCSARLHSLDMYERDFFDHTNPDGVNPFQRMDAAGFAGRGSGENIAVGQTTPEQVMESWMDSDGHCANVMRVNFTTLGVGFHPGAGQRGLGSNFWTQNFGAPPF